MTMNPTLEELVELISQEANIPTDVLYEKINKKLKDLGEFVTDLGAAHIVARELGVDIHKESEKPTTPSMPINEVVVGLVNVTVEGVITDISNLITFTKRTGEEGKLFKIQIADKTGSIRILLWGENTRRFQNLHLAVGDAIKLTKCKAKAGQNGILELNTNKETTIEKIEKKGEWKKIEAQPVKAAIFFSPINAITKSKTVVATKGLLVAVYPKKTFEKENKPSGAVRNIVLSDTTGTIRASLWNEKADKVTEKDVGKILSIVKGYTRFSEYTQKIELSCGEYAEIEFIDEPVENYLAPFTSIREIEKSMDYVNVRGKVVSVEHEMVKREVDNTEIELVVVVIEDDSGKIRVTFWAEDIEKVENAIKGDKIEIYNAKVVEREKFGLQLSIRRNTTVLLEKQQERGQLTL